MELVAGVLGGGVVALVLAQAAPTAGVDDLLVTYGPFAPFAALLLYILRVLWNENRELRTKLDTTNDKVTERLVPLVLDATRLLSEAGDRQLDPSQYDRLINLLDELAPAPARPAPVRRPRGR